MKTTLTATDIVYDWIATTHDMLVRVAWSIDHLDEVDQVAALSDLLPGLLINRAKLDFGELFAAHEMIETMPHVARCINENLLHLALTQVDWFALSKRIVSAINAE